MPGILLDHADVDPAEIDVLAHEAAGIGGSPAGALLTGVADLRVPGAAQGVKPAFKRAALAAFSGGSGRSMVLTGRLSPPS